MTAVAVATMGAARLGASGAPLADAAASFGGPAARALLVAVALLTTAATANAVLVVNSRIVFGRARDRLLPERLSAVSRTGAPWAAVVANAVLLAAVAALGTIPFAATAGGFLYVLHFLPPLMALVVLRRRDGGDPPAFRTPAPRVVLPLAFVAGGALLAASGRTGPSSGWGGCSSASSSTAPAARFPAAMTGSAMICPSSPRAVWCVPHGIRASRNTPRAAAAGRCRPARRVGGGGRNEKEEPAWDEVDLSDDEQAVLDAIAVLEADGEATAPEAIARRAGRELGTVRSALSRLVGEADLVRELDPDAEVVGPRYAVKDSASPR